VRPSITDACFAAFWNSAPLTDQELELRLQGLEGSFLILTDAKKETDLSKDLKYEYVLIRN
jgi:hypothetical protein